MHFTTFIHEQDFLRKMNIRTYMILDALRLGYSVLHTDLDMYFMKNPFEEFPYLVILSFYMKGSL